MQTDKLIPLRRAESSHPSEGGDPSPGEVVGLLQGQHLCPSGGFGEVEGGCAAVFLLGDKRSSKCWCSGAVLRCSKRPGWGMPVQGEKGPAVHLAQPLLQQQPHGMLFWGQHAVLATAWGPLVHPQHSAGRLSVHTQADPSAAPYGLFSVTFSTPFLTLLMLPTSTASGDSRKLTASSAQCCLSSVLVLTHPVVTGSYFGGFEGQFHTHPIYSLCCFLTPGHIPSLPASH